MFTATEKSKIASRLESVECPICKSQDKFITDVPTHVISFPSTISGIDFSKVSYINCLCVHCLNCGYIMQFKIDVLVK